MFLGVIPTFVSPGAKSITRAAIVSSYPARSGSWVDVLPDQRRQCSEVDRCQAASPVRLRQNLLQHERVHVDHTVLQKVQRGMLSSLILVPIARQLAAAGEKHEVVGPVPLLNDVEPLVDLPPQLLAVQIAAWTARIA